MPLLGQIASLTRTICRQLECFPAQKHYEHRERYYPEETCTCIAPLLEGYKHSIKWPQSRDRIWYYNFPHTKLAEVEGGRTEFENGALHYIDFILKSLMKLRTTYGGYTEAQELDRHSFYTWLGYSIPTSD
ncbi:hypothetical protein AB3S75_012810 [Citrus x aurantiifolia]